MDTFLMPDSYFKIEKTAQSKFDTIKAIRNRTSGGFCSISIKVGSDEKSITLTNEPESWGEKYEEAVREIILVLQTIVDDDCSLPETELLNNPLTLYI